MFSQRSSPSRLASPRLSARPGPLRAVVKTLPIKRERQGVETSSCLWPPVGRQRPCSNLLEWIHPDAANRARGLDANANFARLQLDGGNLSLDIPFYRTDSTSGTHMTASTNGA